MSLICYASAMGKGRNRDALLDADWRLLINPEDPREPGAFKHCLDNGAWVAFQEWLAGKRAENMLDEDKFEAALERFGARADFVVLPDIVQGGMTSLQLSLRWSNRCLSMANLVLIAVQDGMEPADLAPYVGPQVGIFLGGSTEWKLERMEQWGKFCASINCAHPRSTQENPKEGIWYHVARVNTGRRFRLAHASGADSIDGSSATKFADTLPLLERARSQPDLYDPRRMAVA